MLIRLAIELTEQRIAKLPEQGVREQLTDDLCKLATSAARYIKLASSEPKINTYREAMAESEFSTTGFVENMFNTALCDVLIQVYFKWIRESLHGEKPLGYKELMELVSNMQAKEQA
jgi:hypothetical protein